MALVNKPQMSRLVHNDTVGPELPNRLPRLHDALVRGDSYTAFRCIREGDSTEPVLSPCGMYSLHVLCLAAHGESRTLVDWALTVVPDANTPVGGGLTAIDATRNPSIIQMLVEHGANPNGSPDTTDFPLLHAVDHFDLDVVDKLIARGADLNRERRSQAGHIYERMTALGRAVVRSQLHGLDGLHCAGWIVLSLIRAGADIYHPYVLESLSRIGGARNLFDVFAVSRQPCVDLLCHLVCIGYLRDPRTLRNPSRSYLDTAAYVGSFELFNDLLDSGETLANANVMGIAVYCCTKGRRGAVLQYVLPYIEQDSRVILLCTALRSGAYDAAEVLIAAGVDINAPCHHLDGREFAGTMGGPILVHVANSYDAASWALAHGADPRITPSLYNGQNAITASYLADHTPRVTEELLVHGA